jgi:putative flippase GtrA
MNLVKELTSYTAIGLVGVLIHAVITILGESTISYVCGFLVANFWSFTMNSTFTFSRDRTVRNAFKFSVVVLISLVLSTIAYDVLGKFDSSLALASCIPFGILLQYFGHKAFTFR